MRRKQRWLLTGLAVATALGAVPATTALAGATDAPAAVPRDRTVTLLSGDRVAVRDNGLQIIPGPGRAGMRFLQQRDGDHRLVVPVDAVAALGRGTLDRRLFDVTGLVAAGYDDRSRATLPLIVAQRGRAAPHLTGLTTTRALPGYRMTAATAPKNDTAALWKQVRSATDSKVWLDGKKQLSLVRSVPQIGAPAAWQAGLTGTGVKVAVLDSGYDPTHPDLTDRVVASRNFSADADVVDHVGHGTHVASTIAGSGAAAGGRFKGVAPGAQLMIGKVCEPNGCQESAMLDGMRWAAESGARVINMSLGGTDTPEVDPIEAAVDELTASTGALFVIAAGNSGPDTGTVGSPGSADAALTVGAVDRDGNLAGFSSRGPRVGDEAVKPDLTGPGVGIV